MTYNTPEVGTILPAQENTTVENPGPVHGSGDGLNEWLQAQAQDTAAKKNQVLVEDWHNAEKNSPEYAAKLGAEKSYAVVVMEAEAGGVYFDPQRVGPLVSTLEDAE
jgi:hypothetical protein